MPKDSATPAAATAPPRPGGALKRFWNSWYSVVALISVILIGRFYLLEPFRIPSGSMEPTLIGHEDYGDHIAANKLAYRFGEPQRFDITVFSFHPQWGGPGPHALKVLADRILDLAAKSRGEGEMLQLVEEYDVPMARDAPLPGDSEQIMRLLKAQVSQGVCEKIWSRCAPAGDNDSPKNYIKRLVGLPGETLVVSGGDLFLQDAATGQEQIIRKWETSWELQERLWQPVARATFRKASVKEAGDEPAWKAELEAEVARDEDHLALPWDAEPPEAAVREKAGDAWTLRVTGPATLTYAHPVEDVYVKLGRWPFRHLGCRLSHLPAVAGAEGTQWKDPAELSEGILPYLADSWTGVQCPHCKRIKFPLKAEDDGREPRLVPLKDWTIAAQFISDFSRANGQVKDNTKFFYGGLSTGADTRIVGDLKLEVELEVLAPGGALDLEAGSSRHRAGWTLSLGGEVPARPASEGRHDVNAHPALGPGGRHLVSLAYVDGTVLASLDGQRLDPLKVDVTPLGAAKHESVACVRFLGPAQVRLTRLDLYRDLHYTLYLDDYRRPHISWHHQEDRGYPAGQGRYVAHIPPGHYMMMGDNSPSSIDSRVWGFAPRQDLVGRGSFIWWPPARCRVMY